MLIPHVTLKGMLGARTGTTHSAGVDKLLPEVFLLNVVHQMAPTPVSATTFQCCQLSTTTHLALFFADDKTLQILPCLYIGIHLFVWIFNDTLILLF